MICHYCKNLCKCNGNSWSCDICSAEFFDYHTNLYTQIKGKKYTFQMRYQDKYKDCPARIICPMKPIPHSDFGNVVGAAAMNAQIDNIINLPVIPINITPENVNEKIRLYLLLS